jgi:protein TonB
MLRPQVGMDLETWTVRRTDTARLKRLVIGGVLGALTVAGTVAFVVLTSTPVAALEEEEDDDPIAVELAKEPEPPPPPPPPPELAQKPKPQRPKVSAPTSLVDDGPIEEKEPTKNFLAEEPEREEPKAEPVATAAPPPPPAKKTVVAKAADKKPIRLTENMAKPVQLVMATPEYPSAAKSQGIEGVVMVRYVIGEDGSTRSIKAVKGPPELQAACVEAVQKWRFQPILVDGVAVAVVRMARFPFRIK